MNHGDPFATQRQLTGGLPEIKELPLTLVLPGSQLTVNFCAGTDTGKKRANNEDTYLIREKEQLFAVFDGMGGAAAGEIASSEARRAFEDTVCQDESTAMMPSALLSRCLGLANERVLRHAAQHPHHAGLGSTVVAALLRGQALHILNLGDSRLYQIPQEGSAIPLTRDHSLAAILIEQGELSVEQARTSPIRNQLLGVIGQQTEMTPFKTSVGVCPGQRFVLCSDGLWDMVTDSEIAHITRTSPTPSQAVERLIAMANAAGGCDNITVIVLAIGETGHE